MPTDVFFISRVSKQKHTKFLFTSGVSNFTDFIDLHSIHTVKFTKRCHHFVWYRIVSLNIRSRKMFHSISMIWNSIQSFHEWSREIHRFFQFLVNFVDFSRILSIIFEFLSSFPIFPNFKTTKPLFSTHKIQIPIADSNIAEPMDKIHRPWQRLETITMEFNM